MDQVLADHLPEVAALCRRHRVARLDVFGSAARQSQGAADLDLLVEFEALPADAYAYFGWLADLEALLERPVDLVMASAVRPIFDSWGWREALKAADFLGSGTLRGQDVVPRIR